MVFTCEMWTRANLAPGATLSSLQLTCQQQTRVLWQQKFNPNDTVDSISKYCETDLTVGMHHKWRKKLGYDTYKLLTPEKNC